MTTDLQTSRTLGLLGSLLLVIGIPVSLVGGPFGWGIALIGIILVLIALKGFADQYNEHGIFTKALYGVILNIVGVVVAVAVVVVAALGFLVSVGLTNLADWQAYQQIDWASIITLDAILPFLGALLAGFLILFVFVIIGALFLQKSFTLLGEKTGVKLFGTAGLILLIGAVLTIVLIGFCLLYLALILITVGFYSIKPPAAPVSSTPPSSS